MIFSKILKLADAHVANMFETKMMSKKKREIAKYSFIAGVKTALMLLENNKGDNAEDKDN